MKHLFCVVLVLFSFVGGLQAEEIPRFIELKGHTGIEHSSLMYDTVECIIFSPDGKKVATSSEDRTTRIWDAETGKELHRLNFSGSALAFSPDGKKISIGTRLSGSLDQIGGTRVFDIETGQELRRFDRYGTMMSSDWTKTVTYIVINNGIPLCGVFDFESGKELQRFKPIGWWGMTLSPDGKKLAVPGFVDRTREISHVQIVDTETGKELHRFGGFTGHRRTLMGSDGQYRVSFGVVSVVFSPDSRKLAIFNVIDASPVTYGSEQVSSWYKETFEVQIVDIETGKELCKIGGGTLGSVTSAVFSGDSKKIVVGCPTIRIFDVATGRELQKMEKDIDNDKQYFSIITSPDGNKVAAIESGGIRLFDVATGKKKKLHPGFSHDLIDISFSPDGKKLGAAGRYAFAGIWVLE